MTRSIKRASTLTLKEKCSGHWMSRTKFATIVEKKVTSIQIAPSRTKETRITRASIAMIQAMMKKKKGRTKTRDLGRRRAMTRRPALPKEERAHQEKLLGGKTRVGDRCLIKRRFK